MMLLESRIRGARDVHERVRLRSMEDYDIGAKRT